MDIEKLNNEKLGLIRQIKAYEELQSGLEHIQKYNRENFSKDELKVFTMVYEPHLEEITESFVANEIEKLTNNLLKVSEKINQIKIAAK